MFTRNEILKLTGLTLQQLRRLYDNDNGLVKPVKTDPSNPKSPVVFSWNTLLEIRAISDLRSLGISLQKLRKAKNYLLDASPDANLSQHAFVLLGNELLIIKNDDPSRSRLLVQVTGRNVGQTCINLLPVELLGEELDQIAKKVKIRDWQIRKYRFTKIEEYVA